MKKTIIFTSVIVSIFVFIAMTSHAIAAEDSVRGGLNNGRGNRLLNKEASASASSSASPRGRNSSRAVILQAQVTAVNTTALTISKDGKSYTVNVGSTVHLRRRFGGKSSLAEYSVGNTVSVWGIFTDANKTTINATQIRNLSIQKKNGIFFGTVKSVGTGTFVLASKIRGDQTVTIVATTKLINRKQVTIAAADIKVGDRVRVHGMWDRSKNTITEVVQVKDFSLPPLASRSPKASTSPKASASTKASVSPSASAEPSDEPLEE